MRTAKKGKAVVVTTEFRGVFFGYMTGAMSGSTIVLQRARNCLYWSADVKGFLGLSVTGPTKACRIGPAVPELTLLKVTAVVVASPEAVAAWEGAPWKL